MNTYAWLRFNSNGVVETEDISEKYAVYLGDNSFGVRTTMPTSGLNLNTSYVLRLLLKRTKNLSAVSVQLFDTEWRYRRNKIGTDPIDETMERRTRDENGVASAWEDVTAAVITGTLPTQGIVIDTQVFDSAIREFSNLALDEHIPGTATIEHEFGIEGQTPIQGGIGTTAGPLGPHQGYDIRSLGVVNQKPEKSWLNVVSDEMKITADIAALPKVSDLFSGGWIPSDDVDWEILVGDRLAGGQGGVSTVRDAFVKFPGTIDSATFPTLATLPASRIIGSIEAIWDGKYVLDRTNKPPSEPSRIGKEFKGNAFVDFNATSKAPDSTDIEAVEKTDTFVCDICPNGMLAGAVTHSCPIVTGYVNYIINYVSHLSECLPASLGYGWSEVSHTKLREDGTTGQIVVETQGGGRMKWDLVSSVYVPHVRNQYTLLSKDLGSTEARYVLTFKNQSKQEFDDQKRLRRERDRNDNVQTYNYNGTTGFLDSITTSVGRKVEFERRTSDGQPTKVWDGGLTTGRMTELQYYPDTDLIAPDRLHKIINPEGETLEYVYNEAQKLHKVIDARGIVAQEFLYEAAPGTFSRQVYLDGGSSVNIPNQYLKRKEMEIVYGEMEIQSFYSFFNDNVQTIQKDLTGNSLGMTREVTFDEEVRTTGVFESAIEEEVEAKILATIAVELAGQENDPNYQDLVNDLYNELYNELFVSYDQATSISYGDSANPFLKTDFIDANGDTQSWEYDSFGNMTKMVDQDDNETLYTYTSPSDTGYTVKQANLVRYVQRPVFVEDGNPNQYPATEMRYDASGNLVEIVQTIDAVSQNSVMTYETDGLIKTIEDFNGHTSTFVYEGVAHNGLTSRNLLEVQTPKGLGSGGGIRKVVMEYDDYDNLTKVTDDLGNVVESSFDDLDRLDWTKDPKGFLTEFDYLNGLMTEVRSPLNNGSTGTNRKTTFTHDNSGRVTEVLQQNGGSQELRVGYDFDGLSQMLSLSRLQNGVSKQYEFGYDFKGRTRRTKDPLERVSKMQHPAFCGSVSTESARGIKMKYLKDGRCLPKSVLDQNIPSGSRTSREFFHDELGRLYQVTDMQLVKYGQGVHGFDDYSSSSDPNAHDRTSYRYNEVDRLIYMGFGDGKSMNYKYDPVGNVTEMKDPEGNITKYEYFRDNLLHKAIFERAGQSDRVFTYAYDLIGRPATITYPTGTGIVAKFEDDTGTANSGFDANSNLLHLRYEKSGTLIRRFEWTYDDSNNRQSQLEVTPTKAVKWEYGFDWFDRLVSVKRAEATTVAGLPAASLQREYVFDESDNRKFFDDHVNGKTYHYKYKSIDDNGTTRYSDQLEEILTSTTVGDRVLANFTSLETFIHDLDGNMTKRIKTGEEITFQWSDYDRLLRVESDTTGRKQDNRYDFNGIRKRKLDKNVNSSREYTASISTSSSSADLGSTVVPTISYLSIGGAIVGYEEDDGTTSEFRFFLTDALSSVRDIVDDTGTVVRSYEFDENGIEISSSGSGTDSAKTWIGGLSVNDDRADSGLFLMGHRHYAPELGRFISRDPIGFAGGLNLYAYANNNPVNYTDADGLEPRYAPVPSGTAWTGEAYAVLDGGTSGIGYGGDPSSWTIHRGPRIRPTGRSSGSGGDSMPSLYDQRNIQILAEHTGLSEGSILAGMMLLGTISAFGGRGGRMNCPPIKTSRFPSSRTTNIHVSFESIGIKGTSKSLKGTFSITGGVATATVDWIGGDLRSLHQAIQATAATAKRHGAKSLRIQGNLGNPKFNRVLKRRFGMKTSPNSVNQDFIEVPLP